MDQNILLWIGFLNPLATLLVAALAYYLGIEQSRKQERYVRQAESINELRIMLFDVTNDITLLPSKRDDEDRNNFSWQLSVKFRDAVAYYRKQRPWLNQATKEEIEPLLDSLTKVAGLLLYDEGIDDPASYLKYDEAMSLADTLRLDRLIDDLEDHVERLVWPKLPFLAATFLYLVGELPGAKHLRQRLDEVKK